MRPRLRDLGHRVGRLDPGPRNTIADVDGVRVGHRSLIEGAATRTGVTAVLPHGRDLYHQKLPAAAFVLNGFGKSVGLVQLEELGELESPILLTNTLSVPDVTRGALEHALLLGREIARSEPTPNVVVCECNDGRLNDIRARVVRPQHALEAIAAAGAEFELGAVGAGTGMMAFGYKAGIGSSSRRTADATVGALVLANFGTRSDLAPRGWLDRASAPVEPEPVAGSIIVVLATDAPLDARQLRRLAVRGALGVARSGGIARHGSGDIVIAFSTARGPAAPDDARRLDPLFEAAVESVHEAILDSLCTAERMIGRDGAVAEAFPVEILSSG